MATREAKSFRLHPLLEECVERRADLLDTTQTWIVEMALVEMFRAELPAGFAPGMRMKPNPSSQKKE